MSTADRKNKPGTPAGRDTDQGGTSRNLRPVSLRLLFEGMTVHDDIYDSGGSRLLVKGGNVLTDDNIERIQRLNGPSDIIYVSGRTYQTIAMKKPDVDIESREMLEHSTGYAAILDKVRILFQDIINTKKVNRDGFIDVTKQLAQIVKTSTPEVSISLVNTIAPADEYLERHFINVALLNGLLGMWLNLPDNQIDKLVLVGLLHDCGHALMPKSILYTNRVFTKIDYEVIKMHTVRTDELLADFPNDISNTASSHHERLDGSGYPKGISGQSIIGASRITAISDIYEAVVSTRPYRSPRSPFYVLSLFNDLAPWQIDNDVVNVLKNNLPEVLMNRPVIMSDGTIGIVRSYDPKDIKYPTVEISKRLIKTSDRLHCVSMYLDD